MKKLLLVSLLVTLSSCASDKGDVVANKAPVKKTDGADVQTCLALNGKYVKIDNAEKNFTLFTKVEDGKVSYADKKDGTYVLADGSRTNVQVLPNASITVSITCDATSITYVQYLENDATKTLKYSAAENDEVKLETTGDEDVSFNGNYAKEVVTEDTVVAPMPAPADPIVEPKN